MATVAPPADQAADLLKNISLDSQTKTSEIPEPTKKPAVENGNGQLQSSNKSVTSLVPDFIDPAMAYYPNAYAATAYYYGGYDGTTNDWEDLAHGVYGYGFAPYGPYSPAGSPVPTVGHDGQLYGAQHYQYSSPYFPPSTPTGGPYPASAAPTKVETTTPAAADQKPSIADTTKGSSNGVGTKGNNGSASLRPNATSGSYGSAQNGFYDPRYSFDGIYSPIPWLNGPMYSDPKTRNNTNNGVASKNQNVNSHLMNPRPMSGMNTASGYMNRLYPNKLYGSYGNSYRSGYGYGYASNAYDLQNNGRGWPTIDNKYKPRGRGYGFCGYTNENGDGLNELNRGPRARITKNQKVFTPIAIAVKGQNVTLAGTDGTIKESNEVNLSPDREQFNKPEFPLTYSDAKFFIIKSYSEDDVHKSIKYNVWASTPNGNKKLDAAFQEAQQKSEGCPVFLFFSVNTSGQFVGVAEMVGQVDFNKSVEYWQQDKWIGCFPVKWHIVKDLPNSLLKHIILENNENKPVTNSRDTQEVKLEQGLEMIKIFKEHSSKQCILDDFEFYEDRQKKIQEKKAKQQQFQKQAWEGKPAIDEKSKDGVKVEVLPPKAVDVADLVNEVKLADSVQDISKPAEMVVVNCVAKTC